MAVTIKSATTIKGNTTVGFSPASLFAAGEQGVWYDPSDFSTMFQDAAGATPVTAVEQSVGLLLDKRGGFGPDFVLNGGFSSGSNWTPQSGWSISGGAANCSAASTYLYQVNPSVVVNNNYQVIFTVTGYVSGSVQPYLGASPTLGTAVSANGTYTQIFSPTTNGNELGFKGNSFTGSIDNVSVKQITGNYATQSTAGNRPVLSARVNLLTKTEQFDDAAWTKIGLLAFGSGSIVNATTAPDGTLTADQITPSTTGGVAHYTNQPAGTGLFVFSFYAKSAGYSAVSISNTPDFYIHFNLATGQVSSVGTGWASASMTDVGNGWWRCVGVNAASKNWGVATIYVNNAWQNNGNSANGTVFAGDGTSGIYIWGADLRVTNDGVGLPVYQRVNTSTDYDTTGFPFYLAFNGTTNNRSMATGNINFTSANKMTTWAGVRKIADGPGANNLVELSADVNSNNGTFGLYAPAGFVQLDNVSAGVRGTTSGYFAGYRPLAAPITVVQQVSFDISIANSILQKINGASVANNLSLGTTSAGTFGNYPLYIGARAGTSFYLNGRIYSLIVRGASSTSDQITATENWVNTKTKAY